MTKPEKPKEKQRPAWELAVDRIEEGPLFRLSHYVSVHRHKDGYPIAKTDWAYVTGDGHGNLCQIRRNLL